MYTEAAALIDNKEYTILGSDEIILATLIIYNPDELRFLKNHLYHEIRHYYDTFKHNKQMKIYCKNKYGKK